MSSRPNQNEQKDGHTSTARGVTLVQTPMRGGVLQHLGHAEDDVGVQAALVGVHALAVVPEEVSGGRAVAVGQRRDQVERLTAAHPQRPVGSLRTQTERSESEPGGWSRGGSGGLMNESYSHHVSVDSTSRRGEASQRGYLCWCDGAFP